MLKYQRVFLDRNEALKLHVEIVPWEVPVFATVNGVDAVRVEGERYVRRSKGKPDADAEFDRLVNRYKDDKGTGQSFVEMVYGIRPIAVPKLAKLIDASWREDGETDEPAPAGDAGGDEELFASLGLPTQPAGEDIVSLAE
ncbi:MAG TPA: hypothetical protein PLE54_11525 [Burkholderiaceae bacterium]|nr:hypothetical protein [Burkholderiaceae bacterium]